MGSCWCSVRYCSRRCFSKTFPVIFEKTGFFGGSPETRIVSKSSTESRDLLEQYILLRQTRIEIGGCGKGDDGLRNETPSAAYLKLYTLESGVWTLKIRNSKSVPENRESCSLQCITLKSNSQLFNLTF